MALVRMQDFGGVRVIVENINDLEELVEYFQKNKLKNFDIPKVRNMVEDPRPTGYRSVHLIFKFSSEADEYKKYNGLLVEMQARTVTQHNWATAVESVGIILGKNLKSGKGHEMWLSFFELTSMAFAQAEQKPVLKNYTDQKPRETYEKLRDFEKKHEILKLLDGMSIAARVIEENKTIGYYHLVTLDTKAESVTIRAYKKSEVKSALKAYSEAENTSLNNANDIVLVSAGQLKTLRSTYPNYFLDIREFEEKLKVLIKINIDKLK